MSTARYYSYETAEAPRRDALRVFLKKNGFIYELSGCFDAFHFEIKATPEQLESINAFLDTL